MFESQFFEHVESKDIQFFHASFTTRFDLEWKTIQKIYSIFFGKNAIKV